MMKTTTLAAASLCLAMGAASTITAATAQSPVRLGVLGCDIDETNEGLFKTHLVLDCTLAGPDGSSRGRYQGTINRTGLAIGTIDATNLSWIVTTVGNPDNYNLNGKYFGAQAGVAAGVGGGANYLIGGFGKRISLQPYSLESKDGIGIELGGQALELVEIPEPAEG